MFIVYDYVDAAATTQTLSKKSVDMSVKYQQRCIPIDNNFFVYFRRPHYLLLKWVKSFFYFDALITYSKNMFNVSLPPSLIRFWIFSDLKQRN